MNKMLAVSTVIAALVLGWVAHEIYDTRASAKLPGSVYQQSYVAVMDLVKNKLSDPESAHFKDLYTRSSGSVCGYVNSKNQFGGYSGFRLFSVSVKDKSVLFEDSLAGFDGMALIYSFCGKRLGYDQ